MTSPRRRKALGALAASAAIGGLVAGAVLVGRPGNRSAKPPESDGEARPDPKANATAAELPDPQFGRDDGVGAEFGRPAPSPPERDALTIRAKVLKKTVSPVPLGSEAGRVAAPRPELHGPGFSAAFAGLNDAARPMAIQMASLPPAVEPPADLSVVPLSTDAAPVSALAVVEPKPAAPEIEAAGATPASTGALSVTSEAPAATPRQESPPPALAAPLPTAVAGVAADEAQPTAGPNGDLLPDSEQIDTSHHARRSIEKRRINGVSQDISLPGIKAATDAPAGLSRVAPETGPKAVAAVPASAMDAAGNRNALAQPSSEVASPAPAANFAAAPSPPSATAAHAPAAHAPAAHRARNLPVPAFGKPEIVSAAAAPAKDFTFAAAALGSSVTGTGDQATAPPGLLGLGSGLSNVAVMGASAFGPPAVVSTDDELILELRTAGGELNETITAYGTREGVFLPLGEVARLLDLAIVVSDDGRYASGWMLEETRTLAINLRARTIALSGTEVPLNPRDAVTMDGELYLNAERFAAIMPLTLKVDLRAQTVTVTTLRPFPFEQRLARESERDRLAGRSTRSENSSYLRETAPWRLASFPVVDVELRGLSDSSRGTRGEADVRLAADVGFMTGQAFVSLSSREGLIASRLELGRRDPDARLLGPLRATEFQIGDVATASMPLGLRGIGGRGVMITNAPLERASVFERIDLRGELGDGFEVELYRNNTLVGSSATPVNGQYAFLQVPVEFGLNVFRLVFYGPQGQTREEVRRISVGDGRLAKGQLVYSFGMAQKDVNLFDVHPPGYIPGQDFGTWRAVGQIEYGVSSNLTTVAGGAWYESLGQRRWLANAGLRTGLGPVATQLDLGLNDAGGKAFELQLGGTFSGISLTAAHAEYTGLFSDEMRAATIDPLRRASEANVMTTAHIGPAEHRIAVPIAARARRLEFADGRVQSDASMRASLMVSRLLLSNSLDLSMSSTPGLPGFTQLTGNFDLTTLSGGRTRLRAGAGYAILPQSRISSVSAEIDRTLGPDTLVKASVERIFDTRETRFGLSAIQRMGPFSLSFDGNFSIPRRDYSAALRLGFSFGRNPISGDMFVSRSGMASSGAVAARAFVDANANGSYDAGESLPPGVEFETGTAQASTGPDGVALIGQLGSANRTYLRINAETLPDIDMASAKPGVAIVPRPGRIQTTDFPVITLSEVEGTAYFGEGRRGVAGLTLWLLDSSGKRIKRVRTSGGGSFLFEQIRPGHYTLALDPDQAKRLGLTLAAAPPLDIPRALVEGGIELMIEAQQIGE